MISAAKHPSLEELLQLPIHQRRLVNWLMRHSGSTLSEIATALGGQRAEIQQELEALIAQGFLQETRFAGQSLYSSNLQPIRDQDAHTDQNLPISKPLVAIVNSSGHDTVIPGTSFTLDVSIRNQGDHHAIIDVSLEEMAPELTTWCLSPQESLALGAQQAGDVSFEFHIPAAAFPATYSYTIVVDALQHYPEFPAIQCQQKLEVLAAVQASASASDPTFAIQPATSVTQPAIVQPGAALQVQIMVQNRSDRVDRFRFVCNDLPQAWWKVIYPQAVQLSGFLLESDCLNLNPGEQDQILLIVTPPLTATAGNYIPTLQIKSDNYSDLSFVDLLYLQITPVYSLQAELRTLSNRIKQQNGLFQVRLTNQGNTQRQLTIHAQEVDAQAVCNYILDSPTIELAAHSTATLDLRVQPKQGWRRPLVGGGQVINFNVNFQDEQKHPIMPETAPGLVIWEARPFWQILPLILAGVLGVGAIAYLLWFFLIRTPESPKIVDFAPEDTQYAALSSDVVHLTWRIREPHRIQSLKLVGLTTDGKPATLPTVYDFSRGLPDVLKPVCTMQVDWLVCRNVRTNARKAGEYVFELTIEPKPFRNATGESKKTPPVKIEPMPTAQIVSFASTQPIYQEVPKFDPSDPKVKNQPKLEPAEVRLNWAIVNPAQLQTLQWIGRTADGAVVSPAQSFDFSQGVPEPLKPFCKLDAQLVCQAVKTGLGKPGDYIFELTTISKTGEVSQPRKSELIKILPKPPRILSLKLNGQEAQPKYVVAIVPGQPNLMVSLAWKIDTSAGSKVELLPTPGSIPPEGSVTLPLAAKPGNLMFTLQVTSPTGQQVVRAIQVEMFDPNAQDPAAVAAAAATAALSAKQAEAGTSDENGGNSLLPVPSVPDILSPLEAPPEFGQ